MYRYFLFAATAFCLCSFPGCGEKGNTVSAPPAQVMTMEEREKEEQEMRDAEAKYDGGQPDES